MSSSGSTPPTQRYERVGGYRWYNQYRLPLGFAGVEHADQRAVPRGLGRAFGLVSTAAIGGSGTLVESAFLWRALRRGLAEGISALPH